jgi:phenylalanyl-tRNA synthetase beta chain
MKIPLRWLADYVAVDLPPAELAHRLTLAGLEVSGVRCYGLPHPEGLRVKNEEPGPVWDRDKIVIARIVKIEPHPNADKLKLPTVEYGAGRVKQLVTGAPNIYVGQSGQKVILALAGSVLFDGHTTPKTLSELKPTTLRGIPSDAMACSSFELGINDEHEGIILLEDEAPVGTPLVDYMGDIVLEVEVLPNMARCLSLIGVAREVAALTGRSVTLPSTQPQAVGSPIEGRVGVVIADPVLSPRYAAGLIEGVKIGPAPGWMQRRLAYAGMRPINNIVDITNYVMLEWGQPLHAFDYDVLVRRAGGKAPTITVRPAREGEILRTLDNVERKLTPDMLVIADEAGAIALAGVMGGAETEVSDRTTNILLESASFDFINIRRTMRALELPSEASLRFSRGIHPEMVPLALGRASELMRQYANGTVARGVVDVYPAPWAPRVVELRSSEVARILGMEMPQEECRRILQTLEFQVETVDANTLRVLVPPHRLDVQEGPADLIEDLVRLYGYDRLPATLLRDQLPEPIPNDQVVFEEKVRDLLVRCGLQEVITYALTTPEREAPLGLEPGPYVQLLNPISADRTVLRRCLVPSVLEVVANNVKNADDVHVFEVGSIYLPKEGQKLPDEPRRLAIALCGRRDRAFWGEPQGATVQGMDFYDLKGIVEALLADLHTATAGYRPAKPSYLHPGKAAEVVVGNRVLGVFGELHPKVAEAYGLAGRSVLVADLDLEQLQAVVPPRHAYVPIPRFPAALRDIAVVVESSIPGERVEAEIRSQAGDLLREVRLFDVYQGESIPAGSKSLAYALTYQAEDRTLTDKEVDKAHRQIEERLRQTLGAQIRGQD